MKIALASDHAGFEMKEVIKNFLLEKGFKIRDFGAFSAESVDYPDFGFPAAKAVARGDFDRGVFFCGSGNGMNIVANKVKGVRSAIGYDDEVAYLAAADTGCRILCFGARFMEVEDVKRRIEKWIGASPLEERHLRRIKKIEREENVSG
ncbi:MAG: RpiB/LacA/LacB family sugar-phosphate isomerase [Elusimicrobia bacterium]|nr:RpiB/LacA/LacB family sugar-phosphate isomerase [Elusimicrobiota bacterium]